SFELTRRHIQRHGPPQAVFVLGDQMASGVIAACVEAGLRVPEDVKIVGGAGLELARHTRPRLSVITQPMEAIGQQACQMIQEMIRRNIRRIEPRRVRGRFIVRESLPVPEPLLRRLEQRYPEMIERDPAAAEKP
ncbi:MAG TPA: substrate-binding domain-containing protein, partial [Phycisphaeraceae bacterium]